MEPVTVPRSEHSVSRKQIDPDAVKVLYRLHAAGYKAYLVGGGVRDLLVGRQPKDFDVSTDAHPHQVKRLFRNCRLIGRRFRLAHVHFGDKIVEVSTFRRRSDESEENGSEDLLIRSDNTFGNAEEDALRRDFTINGLFYNIGDFTLIDYVGGLKDLNDRVVRTIGDPEIRFREDPVRMIRAIKFAARLDFTIEPATYEAILRHREEINKSAQPRVLEEIYRLLNGGAAEASFRLLHQTGLLEILVPEVAACVRESEGPGVEPARGLVSRWLRLLDARKARNAVPSNAVLMASLLADLAFPGGFGAEGDEPARITPEIEENLHAVVSKLGVPRRDTERIFQVYRAQRRLVGQRGRRFSPRSFVVKNYFSEAYEFYALGVEATGQWGEMLERWNELASAAGVSRNASPEPRRRKRRRRRRGSADGGAPRNGFERAARGPGEPWSRDDDAEAEPEIEEAGDSPAPPAAARPASGKADIDEDSQIRFLGWSDQPEILRPRSTHHGPPAPSTQRHGGRGGAPHGSGWRARTGQRTGGEGHGPHGGQRRGGPPRSGGPGRGSDSADSHRRDRRRGRRRPRHRQD